MTGLEAYKKFLLRINKNDTNANISVSKAEFVLLYNEQKRVWLEEKISKKGDSLDIHDLERLFVPNYKLLPTYSTNTLVEFGLPQNFYKYSSSYVVSDKGKCKDRPMVVWLIKPRNRQSLFTNENFSPSFEYEETFGLISNGNLVVYKTDFIPKEAFIDYYREPKNIDIAGYTTLDGTLSTTIDPDDIDDKSVEEILNRCAIEVLRNYENIESTQLAKDRINNEN